MENKELNKKLVKWAGFKLETFPYFNEISNTPSGFEEKWVQPDGTILGIAHPTPVPNFPESLDACFKWLVPKVLQNKWKVRIAWSGIPPGKPQANLSNWDSQFIRQTRPQISVYAETPALALCKSIEKLIDKGE